VGYPHGISKSAITETVDVYQAVVGELMKRHAEPHDQRLIGRAALSLTRDIIAVANAKEVLSELRFVNLKLCDVLAHSLGRRR